MIFRRAILSFVVIAFTSGGALALEPDELLLIANGNVPSSIKTAEFYAKARLVPDGRILKLNLPGSEELPFDRYEHEVVPAVREFLRTNHLEQKVRCLVLFYGVPFRIGSKALTPQENEEVADLKRQQANLLAGALPFVLDAEKLAAQLDTGFVPRRGEAYEQITERTNHALLTINKHLPRASDPNHAKVLPEILRLMSAFGGDAAIIEKLSDAEIMQLLPEAARASWPARRKHMDDVQKEIESIQEKRFDPAARKRMRELVGDGFGLFGYASLLHVQLEYLQTDGTVSSLDNEIALLWWKYYNRSKYLPNPLNLRFSGDHSPVLMTCRLDGPQEGTAMQIILSSLKAEKEGLQGRAVIDSTNGTGPGGVADREGGYRAFDQKLLNVARMVQEKTKLPLTLDKQSSVLPPNSVKDVAIYCGWYSVRNYVPACTFKVGAVGYHVASFEMLSLRNSDEKGWVAGLLNDGIAATCGSVAEPYLSAFPAPDEFFPLLMTGKLTLAEVYWRTVPMTSWMMVCIGDPLYTPFKTNPPLKPEDLSEVVRRALQPMPPLSAIK